MGNKLDSCCAERARDPRRGSGALAASSRAYNASSAGGAGGVSSGSSSTPAFRPTLEYRRQNYLDIYDGGRSKAPSLPQNASSLLGSSGASTTAAAPMKTPPSDAESRPPTTSLSNAPSNSNAPIASPAAAQQLEFSSPARAATQLDQRPNSPSSYASEVSDMSGAASIASLRDVAPPDPDVSDDELEEEGFLQALTAQGSIMKAVACFKQQMYVQSKMHFKRAIQYALAGDRNRHNLLSLARAYGNLASVYEFLMNSEKAAVYHIACINLMRELGETEREYIALQNARVTYLKLEKYKYGLLLSRRSLAIAQTEEQRVECRVWCKRIQRCIEEDCRMNVDGEGNVNDADEEMRPEQH